MGDNLFHSFNEFSVPTLGSAAFNNAGDIANIFSRVTEGSSLNAGIFSGLGSTDAQAGDIRLNATDNIVLDNSFL